MAETLGFYTAGSGDDTAGLHNQLCDEDGVRKSI